MYTCRTSLIVEVFVEFLDKYSRFIPLNLISYIVGWVVSLEAPAPISSMLNRAFVFLFSIDMNEAEKALSEYKTIQDVFTRKLKEGARDIESSVVSPADGTLSQSAKANNDTAVQAKGLTYSLKNLVYGENSLGKSDFGGYTTVYLAPHNYHRVHSPVSGDLVGMRYIPGELWPVNQPCVKWMPNIFVRNERLIFDIKTQSGAMVHAVMVGALNVGKIHSDFISDFYTNSLKYPKHGIVEELSLPNNINIQAGSELGTFMLGSTVVLAYDEQFVKENNMVEFSGARPIKMGESILRNTKEG